MNEWTDRSTHDGAYPRISRHSSEPCIIGVRNRRALAPVNASWLQAPASKLHTLNLTVSFHLTMAPKRSQAREPTPSSTGTTISSTTSAASTPLRTPAAVVPSSKSSSKASANQSPQDIALGIWKNYLDTTPQRTKLIDVFMAFLVVVGALQFVYCVLVGNYVR